MIHTTDQLITALFARYHSLKGTGRAVADLLLDIIGPAWIAAAQLALWVFALGAIAGLAWRGFCWGAGL